MRVAGFDENGLGPRFGPLVVTGILVEVSGEEETLLSSHSGPIDDSKRIFRRDQQSYALGESIALAILASAGLSVEDTEGLRHGLELPDDIPLPKGKIPIWCDRGEFRDLGVRVIAIRTRAVSPARINQDNKFSLTASAMLEMGRELLPLDLCVLGKIGGRKFYKPFLWDAFGDEISVLREEQAESTYSACGTRWCFLRDADASCLPVAMASIVGKYIRELVMLELNARAGFNSPIPYCSGYPGDPRTPELARALSDQRPDPWLAMRER
ncbi:MAG: hypothetical protein ABIN58_07925 [candidate division WOR-3 bacterium]